MTIIVEEELATQYGLNISIFCTKIADWVKWNKANNRNFHDGRYWTYNTLLALNRLFPFWTVDQLRKVIKDAINAGLIVKGCYNQTKYDQTLWYTLTDLGLEALKIPSWENPQIKSVNSPNQIGENPKPIPISNQYINQENKTKRANARAKSRTLSSSQSLTTYPKDFFPDDKRRQLLIEHARRTKNTEEYLINRFEEVSINYNTKSNDWQKKFQEFLESQLPRREYKSDSEKKSTVKRDISGSSNTTYANLPDWTGKSQRFT